MIISSNEALVDNDFICKISSCNLSPDEIYDDMKEALTELNVNAVMHELVKKNELDISCEAVNKTVIQGLFNKGIITEISFQDIFNGDNAKKTYYENWVQDFFCHLNFESMPAGCDVFTYWAAKKSLGEIHSLATCLICGCGIFLSDDSDSRILATYILDKNLGQIKVISRNKLFNEDPIKAKFNRHARQALIHS